MLKKTGAIFLFFALAATPLLAQLGGESTYNFLKINASPKSAALAGSCLTPLHSDVGMAPHNPALLDSSMHNSYALTYLAYLAGISHSSLAGAWRAGSMGMLGASVVSLNYGSFEARDEAGEESGRFSANEFAVGLHYSRSVFSSFFSSSSVNLAASLNTVISQLERYSSYGVALNLGARYRSADKLLNATLSFKNIGMQLKPYREGNREKLPFEIQLGVAKKLERAPIGFSATLNDLQSFSVYNNTQEQDNVLDGSQQGESVAAKIGKEFMSHLSLGVEVAPSKYFYAMAGYSYRRSNELSIAEGGAGTGFSFGLGILLKYFELTYARAIYHAGGATNHFGIVLK
ncbi:MAG: type IX secretion system protein PorQ [Prevotellaceae bacterium]|jgi:hypothetical protein|nr:type IX secretion system protein PorQ [Prevotellaceae bacterium]